MTQFKNHPNQDDPAGSSTASPVEHARIPNVEISGQHHRGNFDVLDYARIAANPAAKTQNKCLDSENAADLPYGELDPYVDPAEIVNSKMPTQTNASQPASESSIQKPHPPNSFALGAQTLDQIDGFQQALDVLEASYRHSGTPAVEIITADSVEHESRDLIASDSKTPIGVADQFPQSSDEQLPIAEDAELIQHEHQTQPLDQADHLTSTTLPTALPIVNPESGEVMYDVRDFIDSAHRIIEPIPNAFEVEPDLFDFKTMDEVDHAPQTRDPESAVSNVPASELYVNPLPDSEIFVAGQGDVISIDGSDGFDHIDLACFAIDCATFSDQVIKIDDQHGSKFEIHYRDIDYALFANGIQIRLDSKN